MIDEVHHLGEESRGATLEAVIVRMRKLNEIYCEKSITKPESKKHVMRVICLSAALPNVSDIGEWLQCRYVLRLGDCKESPKL